MAPVSLVNASCEILRRRNSSRNASTDRSHASDTSASTPSTPRYASPGPDAFALPRTSSRSASTTPVSPPKNAASSRARASSRRRRAASSSAARFARSASRIASRAARAWSSSRRFARRAARASALRRSALVISASSALRAEGRGR
eukprot:30861-Pelagococcus_subviridis.AAC.16